MTLQPRDHERLVLGGRGRVEVNLPCDSGATGIAGDNHGSLVGSVSVHFRGIQDVAGDGMRTATEIAPADESLALPLTSCATVQCA